jgi:hypothetical protein
MARSKKNQKLNIGRVLARAGDQAETLTWSEYSRTEVPGGDTSSEAEKKDAYAKARLLARTNYWLRGYFSVKRAILDYGFTIEATSGKKGKKLAAPTDKEIAAVQDYLGSEIPPSTVYDKAQAETLGVPSGALKSYNEYIHKLREDVWNELFVEDHCVGFWTDNQLPVVLPIEKCRYRDILGIETMFYTHGLSSSDLKFFPPEVAKRFAKAEIALDPAQGEYFKVIKSEMVGNGFGWPSIQSVFPALATIGNMQKGESVYSFLNRLKFRQHLCGYPIESGPMAGKSSQHLKEPRALGIQKIFENKTGNLGDVVTNFDHKITVDHEDIAYYGKEKWESPEHQLTMWGGPIAMIFQYGEGVLPYISQFLRAEAAMYREKVGNFLTSVLNQSMDFPVPVKVTWSNMIFENPQLMAEYLKTALSGGVISQSSFREHVGMNDAREKAKKVAEAVEVKAAPENFQPAYDPNHGDPAALASKGGKPAGKPDGDNQNAGN